MVHPIRQRFAFDDYLVVEEQGIIKHEFLDAQVWAMAGGSPEHAAIAMNIGTLLGTQLRERRCRVYSSDLRVRVRATGLATYPDVSVICGAVEHDPDDHRRQTVVNPKVVVEVLSPSTEDYDRVEKLGHYQRIDSLDEIVLVAHDRREITVVRRDPAGPWTRHVATSGETARLSSIGCELPVDEVYRDPLA